MTTVTPLSRGLAFILFIVIPFFTFLFGVWYGQVYTQAQFQTINWKNEQSWMKPYQPVEKPPLSTEEGVCTTDAMLCPDGSYVGRQSPTCEFAPCPGSRSSAPEESFTCMLGPRTCPNGETQWPNPTTCDFPSCPSQ